MMRGIAGTLLAASILVAPGAVADQACSADDADRARSELNRYLGANPEKMGEAGKLFEEISRQLGGEIRPEQTCEAVARMMAELQRTG